MVVGCRGGQATNGASVECSNLPGKIERSGPQPFTSTSSPSTTRPFFLHPHPTHINPWPTTLRTSTRSVEDTFFLMTLGKTSTNVAIWRRRAQVASAFLVGAEVYSQTRHPASNTSAWPLQTFLYVTFPMFRCSNSALTRSTLDPFVNFSLRRRRKIPEDTSSP